VIYIRWLSFDLRCESDIYIIYIYIYYIYIYIVEKEAKCQFISLKSIFESVTRSNSVKLNHCISFTNKECRFYFNHIWILIIDTSLSTDTIKRHIKNYLWNHFTGNFSSTDPHKVHYFCPSGSCVNNQPAMNQNLSTSSIYLF